MARGLALAVLGIAVAGGAPAALAQSVEVPAPYAIPLPPSTEPNWELSARYWWSEGSTKFNINSHRRDPSLGNPTSILDYEGVEGNTGEFMWSVRNESNTFAKGFIGAGVLSGGSLDDEDFFAGQIKFSDTHSQLRGNSLIYGTIDAGQDFTLLDRRSKIVISPFIGFNYWQEEVTGYGARCNPDDVDGFYCGPPGSIEVPFTTKAITNQANWASLRLGAEAKVTLWDRLMLRGDAAILPVAYLWNEDSHFLRADLGRVPNITDSGSGWGYQLEGEVRLNVTENWAFGAGVRYWYAQTSGKSDFVHFDLTTELNDFKSERFGVFGNATYRFSTF
jgi:hypothetical protein